jgi:PAS domain S-box-containing protein
MWVTSKPLGVDEAWVALREAVPELEQYVEKGQIEILSHEDWYLLGGKFDSDRVLNGWVEKEKSALERGFEGLRLTGNTFWLERTLWQDFVDYEAKINEVIGEHRMIAICTYSLEKCTSGDVIDVIKNHQSTLVRKGRSWFLVEDITKRRLAENRVAESLTKLKKSEEKYRLLIENLNEGVWVYNNKLFTTFVNERMAEMLGYTMDEMIGKPIFSFMDEKGVELAKKKVERRKLGISEVYEFEFVRKDGTRIYTQIGVSPIMGEDGSFAGSIAAVTDITERKRMEEELRKYSEHLEELVEERTRKLSEAERMAAIGETAAMVGHDLRNPLQAIVGLLYLANREFNSKPSSNGKQKYTLKEMLQTIGEQVDYMNKIVSNLQDYAKPLKPQLIETSLHQLIDDAFSAVTVPQKVKVFIEIEEDFPSLMVDSTMMRRVLDNLITNAFQAMPDGGRLTIRASKKDDAAFISVEDTGVGIPKENLTKIFHPLVTTKAKGQGLGLPVCKRMVEAHGGGITVKSEVGRGTTFTIEIPLKKAS